MSVVLPRWLRVILVLGLTILGGGLSFFAYRYLTKPVTLTIASGAIENDGTLLMSAISARLATSQAPIRLKVIEKESMAAAAASFSNGETDLAILRSDIGDLSDARAVAILTHGVLMIIVPPGRKLDDIGALRGKTVGIVGGEVNRRMADALDKEYELTSAKVKWKDLALSEVNTAIQTKQVDALLVVTPISVKFLSIIRDFFPRDAKRTPALLPVDAAGAIAATSRAYESFDLPKATLRASPPMPDDDLTTLRVTIYLLANRKLSDDSVTALTKAIMEARASLLNAHPLVAQISAPSTDKDASIPIHPGAAAYFAGEEKTIFDKYGDQLFYASMLLGMISSAAAAVWKFAMSGGAASASGKPLDRLANMSSRIRKARDEDLDQIEDEIDEIMKLELGKSERGETDSTGLQIALQRVAHLIDSQRRALRASTSVS